LETAVETAIREAREELGEQIGYIEVLGQCKRFTAVTGTLVTPIIGYLHRDVFDLSHLEPSPVEVQKVFTRPISLLIDPTYREE
jgi:8-oxo-dGTP pyrophosphatase MutT (NUDIX family)